MSNVNSNVHNNNLIFYHYAANGSFPGHGKRFIHGQEIQKYFYFPFVFVTYVTASFNLFYS